MQWELIVALVLAIPIILFPAAYVWYLNVGGLYAAIKEMIYIYGYLVIAVGLYAHRKEDEWGYKAVDKAMAGELKLVDEE